MSVNPTHLCAREPIFTNETELIRKVRRYIGDAVIEDGAVTMQRFAGGYFDANGVANYYLTDYQGNVTEVVNSSGVVVQSVRYYPDGEPWMEPTGTNRYTFGGKERVNLGGLNQYDFGPRLLNAAAGVWGAPDRKAEKYYDISPYSYCAGNPVMFTDPTGCIIVGDDTDWQELKKSISKIIAELQTTLNAINLEAENNGWSTDRLTVATSDFTDRQAALQNALRGMKSVEKSSRNYALVKEHGEGQKNETVYSSDKQQYEFHYSNLALLLHEGTHGAQLENGMLGHDGTSQLLTHIDVYDETQAYQIQYAYDPASVTMLESTSGISRMTDISADWVWGIRVNGRYFYGEQRGNQMGILPVGINSSDAQLLQAYPNNKLLPRDLQLK